MNYDDWKTNPGKEPRRLKVTATVTFEVTLDNDPDANLQHIAEHSVAAITAPADFDDLDIVLTDHEVLP